MKQTNIQINIIVTGLLFMSAAACAPTSAPSDVEALSKSNAGPAGYHSVYANITSTVVKLQNFRLRTVDGEVIKVSTPAMEYDLQDLMRITKGLKVDLAGVQFPANALTAEIAEIEVDVLDHGARTTSVDDTLCSLITPKYMNFYLVEPVTMISGEQYLVKVPFTVLNSVQIDVAKKQTCDCDRHRDKDVLNEKLSSDDAADVIFETGKKDSGEGDHNHSGHGDAGDHCQSTAKIQRCELVNRRQLISLITRPADEF